MKNRLLSLGLLLSLLTSCAAPAAESETPGAEFPDTADALAQAILASQPEREAYTAQTGEDLELYLALYGVDKDAVTDGAVYAAGGVDGREVAVLSCGTDGNAAALSLEEYRQSRQGDFSGYVPDQAALVDRGEVVTAGSWTVLLICEDMPAARTALETAAGERADDLPELPSGDGTETVDEKGRCIFHPPGKFDMTPYDTAAIREAYATGDESGLSEKDAAILDKCREALELCVTEDMTDFQKELNLHDWLVQSYYGCYDRTVQDPRTPMGREDNQTPYGLLARGYGICLAYASTFQLLMDLAEIKCITVVGASSSSASDHAWNMVKLEGEWYCVDPTWNASYKEGMTQAEMWPWQHRYFNVTSQELRDTDHQWDYENVPETSATHFRWDGTGELPQ